MLLLGSLGAQHVETANRPGAFGPRLGGIGCGAAYQGDLVFGGNPVPGLQPVTGIPIVDVSSGNPVHDPNFPSVPVYDTRLNRISDGSGGWFVFGLFTTIGGVQRDGLAHVLPDGSVDPVFAPQVGIGSSTDSIDDLVLDGDRLFVAGDFRTMNGQSRPALVALSPTSGALLPFDPQISLLTSFGGYAGGVTKIRVAGDAVYWIGSLPSIGGVADRRFGAVDRVTGALLPWQPPVFSLRDVLPDGNRVWIAGGFQQITPKFVAATDPASGAVLPGGPVVNDMVLRLEKRGDTLWLGGNFTQIDGQPRGRVAAWDTVSESPLPFSIPFLGNPLFSLSPGILEDLLVTPDAVYVAGAFTVNGTTRVNLSAFDPQSGQTLPFDSNPDGRVDRMRLGADGIELNGDFEGFHLDLRIGPKRVDPISGRQVGPALAELPGFIRALGILGDTVYLAGAFPQGGGIAAIDLTSGALQPWGQFPASHPDEDVTTILATPGAVFLAGLFTSLGTTPRGGFGALDPSTGLPLPWDLQLSGSASGTGPLVRAMVSTATTLYVGGRFTTILGQPRNGLAAVDLATGQLLPFDAQLDVADVRALCLSGGKLCIGGAFDQVGALVRPRLAEVDALTGVPTSWAPSFLCPSTEDFVDGITVVGNELWAAGSLCGPSNDQVGLARFDRETALPIAFIDLPEESVRQIVATEGTVCVVGAFDYHQGTKANGILRFGITGPAASATAVGAACGPGQVSLAATTPRLGELFELSLTTQSINPQGGTLFLSAVPGGPLTIAPGCDVVVDPFTAIPLGAVTTSASTPYSLQAQIPPSAALWGTSWRLQALMDASAPSANPWELSNGIEMMLGY